MTAKIALESVWAFGAAACCAFYFNAEKRDALIASLLAGIGWFLFCVCKLYGGHEAFGCFCASCAVASGAEVFAVIVKRPATVYLVPGIIPLVPGGGVFLMMRSAVQGDFSASLSYGYSALGEAVAIALGIAIASSIARTVRAAIAKRHRIHR